MQIIKNCLLALAITLSASAVSAPSPEPADTVLVNGGIYTVDARRSWAQAAAIHDGRIVAVGTNDEIAAYRGAKTTVIDLTGRMALPGFHDSHVHLASSGLDMKLCPLYDLASIDALLAAIGDCARQHPEGWLVGSGWVNSFFDRQGPTKELLDSVVPDRPVILLDSDGHSAWANSLALTAAGITAKTPDPLNGVIERNSDTGEPRGTLRETAIALVTDKAPPPTDQKRIEGLELGLRMANSFGITSIIEAAAGPTDFMAFGTLAKNGELTAKSRLSWTYGMFGSKDFESLLARRKEIAGPRLDVDSIKIFLDGVLEGETAALLSPYLTNPSSSGSITMPAAELNAAVTRFDAMGLQVHMHAIGDAATRAGLDAFEAARATNGPGNARHHISHLEMIDAADMPRFAALGVTANFQALWAYPDEQIIDLNLPKLGPERIKHLYPIASVQRAGARIVGGSDWSVSSMNPLLAMQVAMTRQDPSGKSTDVLNADERVDLPTMIAAYTIDGAWLMHHEDQTGSIEKGKAADVVVLDRDLFKLAPADIGKAQVDLTLLDGETIYQRANSL